jgi:hypothetical protein
MKIETELNKDDYKKFRQYIFFNYRKTYLVYLAGLVIFILIGWPRGEPITIPQAVVYIIINILIFLFFYGLYSGVLFLVRKLIRRSPISILGTHTFEIQEDAFVEQNRIGLTKLNYTSINHIGSTKNHFFIFSTNGGGMLVPKRAFSDKSQENDFHSLLNQKITDNKPVQ